MNQLATRSSRPLSAFGRLIRWRCADLGITTQALAGEAKVNYQHLSKLMHGRHKPTFETCELLAARLGLPVEDLMKASREAA
jgi:transcriptional regulator with XRE-family HTH domain